MTKKYLYIALSYLSPLNQYRNIIGHNTKRLSYHNSKQIRKKKKRFHFPTHQPTGALTAGINYYRANFGSGGNEAQIPNRLDGSDGMYVLGEFEEYISKETLEATKKEYPKIRVEVVPGANHFLQQHTPKAVNDLLRDFFGSPNDCPTEPLI